jgi:hypothetical protein
MQAVEDMDHPFADYDNYYKEKEEEMTKQQQVR